MSKDEDPQGLPRLHNPRLSSIEAPSHPLSRDLCKPNAGQSFIAQGVPYILGGHLGDGAAGLVRKASTSSGQVYAVKFLAPDSKYIEESSFDDVARRFKREGERGVHLKHPHLIEIRAYSDNSNGAAFNEGKPTNPFIIMEYVKGRTLESYIHHID
jgi:serine/threonine protein kinase